jgi:hypothetical protein
MTALQGEALVGLHRSMTARARLAASAAQSTIGGKLMGWMAPASIGVAMRHNADVDICL